MAIAIVQWEKMRPDHGIGSVGGGSFRDRANRTGWLDLVCEREGGVEDDFRVLFLGSREDGGTIKWNGEWRQEKQVCWEERREELSFVMCLRYWVAIQMKMTCWSYSLGLTIREVILKLWEWVIWPAKDRLTVSPDKTGIDFKWSVCNPGRVKRLPF